MPVRSWTLLIACLAQTVPAVAAEFDDDREGIHGGLSVGAGLAYDAAGLRGEIGSDHYGVFVGIGLLGRFEASTLTAKGPYSFSAGARWYSGIRRGLFVSLNLTHTWWSDYFSFDEQSTRNPRTVPGWLSTATVTVGYRWRFGPGFFEAALGGGAYGHQDTLTDSSAAPGPLLPQPAPTYGVLPDVSVGLGFEL
jgi:hypothetical protein